MVRPSRARRLLRAALFAALAFVLAVLALRVFVGDVYPVSSSSMRPTLLGGAPEPGAPPETEWVFVRYDRSAPARHELVVLDAEDGAQPLVKRVLGLPGERVRLARGDLYVNGALLGSIAPHAVRPVLWDSALHDPRASWTLPADGGWSWSDTRLEYRPQADGDGAPAVQLHAPARDGSLGADGRRWPGRLPVNDLALELSVLLPETPGAAVLRCFVTEAGDAFCAELVRDASGAWRVRLRRAPLEAALPVLEAGTESAEGDVWETLAEASAAPASRVLFELANVDDALTVLLDGAVALEHRYERNAPLQRPGVAAEHVAPRAGLAAAGAAWTVDRLRVRRDLFWVPQGAFAADRELLLGPDEIFVLGDNSRASTDSRDFGPVRLERVTGRPRAVVWPLERRRRL